MNNLGIQSEQNAQVSCKTDEKPQNARQDEQLNGLKCA